MFYTNAICYGNSVLVRGYNNGKRFQKRVRYQPKLWVDAKGKETVWKNIFGEPIEDVQFDSIKDAKEFIKNYSDVSNFRMYGLPRFEYVFLNETFPGEVKYDLDLIQIANLDIEVASDEGFPDVEKADKEVISVTIHRKGIYHVFGTRPYSVHQSDVVYHEVEDEEDLLRSFLDFWMSDGYPDIVTGWHINYFDLPYLYRRMIKVLGEEYAKKLSPWGLISSRTITLQGREQTSIAFGGVSSLDYLELYRKFTYSSQESYRLDHIATVELGEGKIDYSVYEGIHKMYLNDYQTFIDYNIKDVGLVGGLEEKNKFILMAITLAYDAKVNFGDVFAQVRMWDVLIHNHLWQKKVAVPVIGGGHKFEAYVGAYVKEPQIGMHDWVVSFDLDSLYPHLIMQYNISPEKLSSDKIRISVDDFLEGKFTKKPGHCIAANGCYFKKDSQGFLAEMMEKLYNDRVVYKNLMLDAQRNHENAKTPAEKKRFSNEISRYKNMQLARKVQLNSAYGAIGNPHFRFFNLDQATAITTGGQASIRWVEDKINDYLNKTLKTKAEDYVIASDTDSLYLRLGPLVDKVFPEGAPKEKIVDFLDKASNEIIKPKIDEIYADLAQRVDAISQKMSMKRETISDKGVWTAKKRYALNVYDSEGVRYSKPKMKIMGLEAIKSSTPSSCRDAIKKCLELVMNANEEVLQQFITDYKKEFVKLPFEDIAFPRSISEIKKFEKQVKNRPIHVRGAFVYNNFLKEKDLLNKYDTIKEGEKIKYCYMKMPNPVKSNVLTVPYYLPDEFGLKEYIDYELQFQKAFLDPLNIVLNVIGWSSEKVNRIDDFFG